MIGKKQQHGFTLIEMVMVLLIISVISVVLGKILFQAFKTFTVQQNVAESDWQELAVLERLTNDIHTIRSANDITTIAANQLIFIDVNGNSIQYAKSGNLLLRNGQVLASGVTNLVFTYLTNTGATASTASAVRYIAISLTLTQGNLTTSISSMVGTRGLS